MSERPWWRRRGGALATRFLLPDAVGELVAHWRAHLLTFIGIVWGTASVILLLSVGSGFEEFLELGVARSGDDWISVRGTYTTAENGGSRAGRTVRLTIDDVVALQNGAFSAQFVAGEIQRFVSVEAPRETRAVVVSASNEPLQSIQNHRLARGRWFGAREERQGARVAVLGSNVAGDFFGAVDPQGQRIRVQGVSFEVVGVLQQKGLQLMVRNDRHDNMIFVPLEAGRRVFGDHRRVDEIYAVPWDRTREAELRGEFDAVLRARHHLAADEEGGLAYESIPQAMRSVRLVILGLHVMLGLIGTLTLAMAGVGVGNLMIASVNSRGSEFATRRACGARSSDVLLQTSVETAVIVLAGGIAGACLGVSIVGLLNWISLPEVLPRPRMLPSVLITCSLVLSGVGVAAGVVPARIAARVEPGIALRTT